MLSNLKKPSFILYIILCIGLLLRVIGIDWDQGLGLHPDERMLVMVTEKISFENLNPNFFNYGNLPVYLLKGVASLANIFSTQNLIHYDGLLAVGRTLSAFFDTATTFLVFLITQKLWSRKTGLVAAALYATAVFPIQNAHYFTVDTMLTFWITLLIYLSIRFSAEMKIWQIALLGITCGLAGATKFTGIISLAIPSIILAINSLTKLQYSEFGLAKFTQYEIPVLTKNNHSLVKTIQHICISRRTWYENQLRTSPKLIQITESFIKNGLEFVSKIVILLAGGTISFFATQPYAYLEFTKFWDQVSLQLRMSQDATIFPYTLQFIDTPAYLYPVENIVRWGLGYPLGLTAIAGFILLTINLLPQIKKTIFTKASQQINKNIDTKSFQKIVGIIVLICFTFVYFGILGRSAVKFMRYFLPIYPILAISATYLLVQIWNHFNSKYTRKESIAVFIGIGVIILIWPISFMTTYFTEHPRITATKWINDNLPPQSAIAVEHWDDRVPLRNNNGFTIETLEVYQPESVRKWAQIQSQLNKADYIVISSKRVYRSITNWPEKYPDTTNFYQDLFSNQSEFKLIKEFTNYPRIGFGEVKIVFNDDDVQESFTSYDHPKVLVFGKINPSK